MVISPIGAENSEIRRHADVVFSCIIEPACHIDEDLGGSEYEAERGDHKTAPGKITDQIYEDILGADLIIAVLTGANPNVYYELAIAQSAAKPVILLMEKGFDAPFDIKDQRIIYYDFDPQRIFHKTYVKQLRAAIVSLEMRRARFVVPFAPDLAPLGDPMHAVYQKASEAEEDTVQLLRTAERFVYMAGYALKGWTMNQDFERALKARAPVLHDGVKTMLMSPENPTMGPSMKSDAVFKSAKQSAGAAQGAWQDLLALLPEGKAELRLNLSKSINYQMAISDKEAIVIPYLTSRDTERSPYIYARKGSFYYDALVEEFEFLWENSQEIGLQPADEIKPRAKKT
jgi:hypothetical protein